MHTLRDVAGDEITEYSRLLAEASEQAVADMIQKAEEMEANAVSGVPFVTSTLSPTLAPRKSWALLYESISADFVGRGEQQEFVCRYLRTVSRPLP